MNPWKVILATIVIYAAGVVTGGLLVRQAIPAQTAPPPVKTMTVVPIGPPTPLQRIDVLKRISKQLDLSPEQHRHVERILRQHAERTKPMLDEINPRLREELSRTRELIRAELTPEQQAKFSELLKLRPPYNKPDDRRRPIPNTSSGIAPLPDKNIPAE